MSVNKVNTDGSLSRIAGGTLYADAPIGAIQAYGGATAPSGWLLCHGQAISRTTYAELFAAIGTAFGEGNGSTTFNVPDLREATTKGVGLSGKSSNHYDSDGVALGEFVDDRVISHNHLVEGYTASGDYSTYTKMPDGGNISSVTTKRIGNAGVINSGKYGATNEVKAVGVNYIIKAVQTAIPRDIQQDLEEMFAPTIGHANMAQILSGDIAFYKIQKMVVVDVNITPSASISGYTFLAGGLPNSLSNVSGWMVQNMATHETVNFYSNGQGALYSTQTLQPNVNYIGHFVYIAS